MIMKEHLQLQIPSCMTNLPQASHNISSFKKQTWLKKNMCYSYLRRTMSQSSDNAPNHLEKFHRLQQQLLSEEWMVTLMSRIRLQSSTCKNGNVHNRILCIHIVQRQCASVQSQNWISITKLITWNVDRNHAVTLKQSIMIN